MSVLRSGQQDTEHLPANQAMTIVASAGGSGSVLRLGDKAGESSQGTTPVATGTTKIIGPFNIPTQHQITCAEGTLTVTIARVDFQTAAEAAAAAQVIADTEEAAAVASAAIAAQGYATAAQAAAIAAAAAADWTIIGTIGDLCEVIGAGVPAASAQATLDVNPAGDDNGLTFTAVAYGAAGNSISIAYVNPGALSAALSVGVVGNAITVNLATDAGVQASKTVNPAGDDNSLTFTAVTAGPAGNSISIAYVDPAANDAALSVVVVGNAITVNLATGVAGAITSTAALVLAAIEASGPAAALVTVAIDAADTGAGDDGSGVVTAMALANLENGANGAITSTAALILAAIEASGPADALVTVAIMTGDTGVADDGSGVVTAMALDLLEGGTGVAVGVAGKGSRYTDTTNGKLYINGGTAAQPDWKIVTSA